MKMKIVTAIVGAAALITAIRLIYYNPTKCKRHKRGQLTSMEFQLTEMAKVDNQVLLITDICQYYCRHLPRVLAEIITGYAVWDPRHLQVGDVMDCRILKMLDVKLRLLRST